MKKRSKVRLFTGIFCILLVLVFTIYISIIMIPRIKKVVLKDSFIKTYISELIVCVGLLILSLDILFGFFTATKNNKLKVIGWIMRIVLILSVNLVFAVGLKICIRGSVKNSGKADNAVVLGLALQNGQPTPDLINRVEMAEEFSREFPDATLILTGGNPDENGITEAAIMRDLLVERGISEDRIIIEDKATITIENFRNTAQMVDPTLPIVLITSNYHMDRALTAASEAGFTNILRRPVPSSNFEYGANLMYEVVIALNNLIKNK